tara:strand:- start:163 stop:414 length:252 start_codon:yes stop_codon:yes gene_type:complete
MWIMFNNKMFNVERILYFDRHVSDNTYDKLYIVYHRYGASGFNGDGIHSVEIASYRDKDCHKKMEVLLKRLNKHFNPTIISID